MTISPTVAAVVSAPAVMDAWFELSKLRISVWNVTSWSSLSRSGPVRTQSTTSLMLALSCDAEVGDAGHEGAHDKGQHAAEQGQPADEDEGGRHPSRHPAGLQPVHGGGQEGGQQQRDGDGNHDRRDVGDRPADGVERSDHDEQPPPQRGPDPQYPGYVRVVGRFGALPPVIECTRLRWPERRVRRSGHHSRCSLAGRHPASVRQCAPRPPIASHVR